MFSRRRLTPSGSANLLGPRRTAKRPCCQRDSYSSRQSFHRRCPGTRRRCGRASRLGCRSSTPRQFHGLQCLARGRCLPTLRLRRLKWSWSRSRASRSQRPRCQGSRTHRLFRFRSHRCQTLCLQRRRPKEGSCAAAPRTSPPRARLSRIASAALPDMRQAISVAQTPGGLARFSPPQRRRRAARAEALGGRQAFRSFRGARSI
mmetsp:Transcript_80707/g.224636  ORF Transcript_80707/g.224636 Transcript_80707/m.224636 type:complete len:204 (-) Transcript_80707:225-836(-)